MKARVAKSIIATLVLGLLATFPSAPTASATGTIAAPTVLSYLNTGDGALITIAEGNLLNSQDTPTGYYLDYSLDFGETWINYADQGSGPIALETETRGSAGVITLTGLSSGSYSLLLRFESIDGDFGTPTADPIWLITSGQGIDLPSLGIPDLTVDGGDQEIRLNFSTPQAFRSSSGFPFGNTPFVFNASYIYTLDGGQTWSNQFESPVFLPVDGSQESNSFTIEGLENGSTYDVGVSLYLNGYGVFPDLNGDQSPTAVSSIVSTLAEFPASIRPEITSITPGNSYLQIFFNNPPANNFDVSINGGLTWRTLSPNHNWSPLTIFGLTNGTQYDIKIRARYNSGIGLESFVANGTPTSQTQILDVIDGENGFLQSAYAEVGMRDNGAFGSSTYPSDMHAFSEEEGCLGFRVDRQKNGFGPTVGYSTPFSNIDDGDFFCPGNPYEGWAIEYNNQLLRNSNYGAQVNKSEPLAIVSSGNRQAIKWQGQDLNGLQVTQIARLDNNGQVLGVDVTLANQTESEIQNLYYQRSVDPDNATGSTNGRANRYFSRNIVLRTGMDSNGAQVKAQFDSGAEIYLGSADSGVHASICYPWSMPSEDIYNAISSPADLDNPDQGGGCTTESTAGDHAIALAWLFPRIPAGESVTLSFTYSLTAESALLPTAEVLPASGVGAFTTATLNGTVNANGLPTVATFEYGTTPNLSGSTTIIPAYDGLISGFSDTPLSNQISNLLVGTTIYYRVIAVNSVGTTMSEISSFTPVGALSIRVRDLSDVSETTTTINAGINPAGGTAINVTFEISMNQYMESGTVDSLALPDIAASTQYQSINVPLQDLTPGATYFYRISATNLAGTVQTEIRSFTTPPAPSVRIDVANSSSTTAILTGFVNTYNSPTSLIEFRYSLDPLVETYTSVVANPSSLSGDGEQQVGAEIDGLIIGQIYYFVLVATNENGTNISAVGSFNTGAIPQVFLAPPTPSGLSVSFDGLVLPGGSVTNTYFYISTDPTLDTNFTVIHGDPFTISGLDPVEVTGILDTSLSPDTTYYVGLLAENDFGPGFSTIESFTTSSLQTTHPTVEISAESNSIRFTDSFQFDVAFSTSVTGFGLNDLTLSGTSTNWILTSMADPVVNVDGSQYYRVTAVPASAEAGTLIISMGAGLAVDTFGNPNDASNDFTVEVTSDSPAPPAPTPVPVQMPVPEPRQTSSITDISQSCSGNNRLVVITGTFSATIINISINNKIIDRALWSQTANQITIRVNSFASGVLEIQIYNGQVQILPIRSIVINQECMKPSGGTAIPAPSSPFASGSETTPVTDSGTATSTTPTPTDTPKPSPTPVSSISVALSFSAGSAVLSADQIAKLKKSLSTFKGAVKIIGYVGTSKAELKASLAAQRASVVRGAVKRIAPKVSVTITRPTSAALKSACSTMIPKAKNQCALVYSVD